MSNPAARSLSSVLLAIALLLGACGPSPLAAPTETPAPLPSDTPAPTATATETPLPTGTPTPTTTSTPTVKPTRTKGPTYTPRIPTATPEPAAPVIDMLIFPDEILCDGYTQYTLYVDFHDVNGDAYRFDLKLIQSKRAIALQTTPGGFDVPPELQRRGVRFPYGVTWGVPGDFVKIRVAITDEAGQVGWDFFEFRCQ